MFFTYLVVVLSEEPLKELFGVHRD
jgi:hypothetical protein